MTPRDLIRALADALDEAAAGQTVDAHLCASARAYLDTPDTAEQWQCGQCGQTNSGRPSHPIPGVHACLYCLSLRAHDAARKEGA